MGNLEKELVKFLTESLLLSLKKTWFLLIVITAILIYFSHDYIQSLPKRYEVVSIVKIGKLEKRSYKSGILDNMKKVTAADPMISIVGLSSTDLEILLKNKYLNHRSKLKKMEDTGPFVTEIKVPYDSKLIVIKAESTDIQKGKETINIIIDDLKDRFNKQKKMLLTEVNSRLNIIKNDHKKLKKQIEKVNRVSNEVGFSPTINQQLKDLMDHEARLRYMMIDIQSQLSSDKVSQFDVLSIKGSKYPVTMRKIVYYIAIFVLSFILYILILIIYAVYCHKILPPILPNEISKKDNK